ncbi:interleukin-18-binding protein isoform X2 [Ahaetulla prasina]|uniref:interleukin-18-binding protein isoform X2 n=1 Tax=Ahaetulla prasina TaxID=499056 RepID=UPI002647FA20|nr:interleukin-18-binding protein isoform X2 [Ahaetulla prasina]
MPPSDPDAWPLAGCLLLVLLSVSPSIQGQKVRVSCEGRTIYPESGIMYWLANGTFVDQLYPNGTVKEEATEEKGSKLTRKLIFSRLTVQDLRTRFDCLITDPSGVFQKTIQWDYSNPKEIELPKTFHDPTRECSWLGNSGS